MKPHGPIPPGFAADADGMLRIGGRRADALAEAAGDTPLFVYDRAMLTARAAEWRTAMPVSYTHLDVYKRQGPAGREARRRNLARPRRASRVR